MDNALKRVAAIHDLSGFGKASLTVVIPTISAMGIQVCPLPTAVLSAHTGFDNFTFLDLTGEMKKIISHWKSLNLHFDAIYSGFLGSSDQVDIVSRFITDFHSKDQLVVVDPVVADDGKLYPTMNQCMVLKMKELVRLADIITPNLTELAFLLNKDYQASLTDEEIKKWLAECAGLGPKFVVTTSVPVENSQHGSVVAFDRENDRFWRVKYQHVPARYSGTGDAFTSVLLGRLLTGDNLPSAIDRAVQFISLAIKTTFGYTNGVAEELMLEKVLHTLKDSPTALSYEVF